MIKPTIGRVLWYHSTMEHEQPLAALVSFVHSDTEVNLGGFHANGRPFNAINVKLWQGEGERPVNTEYCEWMPYQQGQAAKTQEAESKLAATAKSPMEPAKPSPSAPQVVHPAVPHAAVHVILPPTEKK